MIIPMIAYCPSERGKDLGYAYNECMRRLRPGDWAGLIDHDAIFTTPHWYRQLEQAIQKHPRAAAFCCVTNRVGCRWQLAKGVDPHNHDMLYHRKVGRKLLQQHGSKAVDVTDRSLMSGVFMCLSADAWKAGCRFKEGGFFGVDNSLHEAIQARGRKLFLLPGLYVYHFYRGDGDVSHLPMKSREVLHFPKDMQP